MVKKFRLAIFLVLIFCLIISSFLPQELAHKYFYKAFWFKTLWVILAIGLFGWIVNSLKKKLFAFSIVYTALLLILLGGILSSFLEEEGFMEIKKGQTQDRFWVNDNLVKPLDFSIYLKDFSVEFYPQEKRGMRFVKSYKSGVTINKQGNPLKESVIEVNRPLGFEGYNFYQYGYDADKPSQTILQVVKDPGLPFVYSGYLILLLGLLTSFRKIWKI